MSKLLSTYAIAALISILLVAGYGLFWFYAAFSAKERLQSWTEARREKGWTVEYEKPSLGGFPLSVSLTLNGGRLASPTGGLWEFDRARVWMRPWAIRTAHVDLSGEQRFGPNPEATTTVVTATKARLDLEVTRPGDVEAGHFEGEGLAFAPLAEKGGPAAITVEVLSAGARWLDPPEPVDFKTATIAASLSAQGVAFASADASPLGDRLETITFRARVMGPIQGGPLYDTLMKWRDDGGTVELDQLYFKWPPLEATIGGTVALDEQMQAVAALSSRLVGFFPAVDLLEQRRIIRGKNATVARVILGAMATKSGDEEPHLAVPLAIQGGKLSLGPVTLLAIPKIVWAQKPSLGSPQVEPTYEVDQWGNLIRKE